MKIEMSGIQCDNPTCDYVELDNNWGNTTEEILLISESYLNKPCPKCGESLMTPEDHDAVKRMFSLQPIITELENMLYDGKPIPEEDMMELDLGMDGTGEIKIS